MFILALWHRHVRPTVPGLLHALAILAYVCNPAKSASCDLTFQDFSGCSLLSPNAALHWRDDGDAVTIALEIEGTWDWLGFGVSEAGGMKGADMAIVRRNLTGDAGWWIGDYWSVAFQMPGLDVSGQDDHLTSAAWTNGTTTAVFWRPLDTCNEEEDRQIIRGTMQYFIYAYGVGWGYHGTEHRGTTQLVLLPLLPTADPAQSAPSSPAAAPSAPNATHIWEVRMDKAVVPAQDTSYLCRDFEVPNPDTKVHAIRGQVAVENPIQVHHMIIYVCTKASTRMGETYDCTSMDSACVAFYTIWAPGINHFDLPAEAGLPLGGDSDIRWLALQVHYTNPSLQSGIVDSSGFLLTISTDLRQYDMGILALGALDFAIPPGNPNYTVRANLCPSACTQRLQHPITLVQSGFHMHKLGKTAKTRWFRDGKELKPLNVRSAYDFDYQGFTTTDVSRNVLLPGDELLTTCTWDSTSRNTTTYYGEATTDEMCFHFIAYYPRVPGINICTSYRASRLSPSQPFAVCSTVGRLQELGDVVDTRNVSAIYEMFTAATSAGELVPATMKNYTAYAPVCPARNDSSTNSSTGGGSGGVPAGSSAAPPAVRPTPPLPSLSVKSPSPAPSASRSPSPAAKPPQPSPQPPPKRKPPPPRSRRPPPPRKVTTKPPPPSRKSPRPSPPLPGAKHRSPPPRRSDKSPPPKTTVRKPPPPSPRRSPPPHDRGQHSPAHKGHSGQGKR